MVPNFAVNGSSPRRKFTQIIKLQKNPNGSWDTIFCKNRIFTHWRFHVKPRIPPDILLPVLITTVRLMTSKCSKERYFKVRATAKGEGRPLRWGLWNTEIGYRLPWLQLLLSILSRKKLEKVWTVIFPHLPTDWTLMSPITCSPLPPAHHPLSCHLYMLPNSLFCLCGLFGPVVAYFLPL